MEAYKSSIYDTIFWLFWAGIFKSSEDIKDISSHLPIYVMMLLLIFEK